ncbi:acetylglutamate kinase [Alicyclobacillus shizuokensis]|uniref:acetylglutamate kinase n=1 Tax=Alicyclobacillus shizuokensis TaxID=392014 RepID=UPI000AE5C52D|nr:acetylglutamate kinase [Alicyclobacillus shizuokensis]MCL6625371.1 acetylglutamate kinase [Alicyclobacillus shizuokensis]
MAPWVVIKVGGSLQGAHADVVVAAIRQALATGRQVVVVHGGGPRISERLRQAGIEQPFVQGQRLTTEDGVRIVEQVLAREVNPELVAALRQQRVNAVGIAGCDGVLFAEPWPGLVRTGRIYSVDATRLRASAAARCIPVLAPVAADEQGLRYNVNADGAAAAVAMELKAERIVFFTDVPGIFSDFANGERLVDTTVAELQRLMSDGSFAAGMIPKVRALCDALSAGVGSGFVLKGDARLAAEAAVTYPGEQAWADEHGTRVRAS